MMILKDPLYGFISIGEPFKALIETEYFQRLRNIKQLGQSYLIYPSANHSRFEHSTGVFYLAQKIAEKNKIEHKDEFIAAALLHDIGHYPFSHAIEKIIWLMNSKSHEFQTINLIRTTKIAKVIEKAKLDIDLICNLISGKGKYGKLIAGQIDVDRLDYLKRDSYYTGVAYGVIEADIIIANLMIKGANYIVDMKYLPAFESILISRYLMYSMVYMHRKTLVANAMLRAAFCEALAAGEISLDQLIKFDDIDLISRLRSSKTAAELLIDRINNRKLYSEALIFRRKDFGNLDKIKKINDTLKIEEIIAKELKLKNYEILINVLGFPKFNKSKILISPFNQQLEKISPLVNALDSAEWNYWFVGIYCPQKHIKKVQKAKSMIKRYLLA